jgi:hypothetical protein
LEKKKKKKKKKILGCPRPKYLFSGLPNLLSKKIRLPLISFFSGVIELLLYLEGFWVCFRGFFEDYVFAW